MIRWLVRNNKLKIKYLAFLKIILNRYVKKLHLKLNSIYIKALSKHIYPVLLFLKSHTNSQFNSLVDIVCYDSPGRLNRFSLIYNLLSLELNYRIKVCTKVIEGSSILSTVSSIYPGAGWLEREVWDLFGVFFISHKDLRRILTDYGFLGHPLRKDFPLSGFVEVIYDSMEKRVTYKSLELTQDFRHYGFKNTWKC